MWGYPCWGPSQAGVEDFTAQIEDHGMRERGGMRGVGARAGKGVIGGDPLSFYIIQS